MHSTICAPRSIWPLATHSILHCGGSLGLSLTLVSGGPAGPPLSGMRAPTLASGRCGVSVCVCVCVCAVVASVCWRRPSGRVARARLLAEPSPVLQSLRVVASSGPATACCWTSGGRWACRSARAALAGVSGQVMPPGGNFGRSLARLILRPSRQASARQFLPDSAAWRGPRVHSWSRAQTGGIQSASLVWPRLQ